MGYLDLREISGTLCSSRVNEAVTMVLTCIVVMACSTDYRIFVKKPSCWILVETIFVMKFA
jgi:hypothetical protein